MALADIAGPKTEDVCAVLGASFSKTFALTQGGLAINLTGYTAEGTIYDAQKQEQASLTAAVDVPETGGEVTISLTVAQVEALPKVKLRYVLKLVGAVPDTDTHIVLIGDFGVDNPADAETCC